MQRPAALDVVLSAIAEYASATAQDPHFQIFNKSAVPFPKGSDEFWWSLLVSWKPFRSVFAEDGGDQPLISRRDVNPSQTPRVECELTRGKLLKNGWDVGWIFDDEAPDPEITIVQVDPSSNFLDRSIYAQIHLPQWKLAEYATKYKLVNHTSEVPQFLGYRLTVLGNSPAKCARLDCKPHLRNTPANLLTIDKKQLEAPVDIHGKIFVTAQGRHLTTEELRELVIFCMGQAEASELRLKSWQKLREALQEEARKFLMSAQHVRAQPALQAG